MNKYGRRLIQCVLASAFIGGTLFAGTANAGTWYAGLGLGNVQDSSSWFDDKTTMSTVFAGYEFGPHFGIELNHVKSGDFECCGGVKGDGQYTALSLVGILPLSQSSRLFGKVGEAKWEFNTDSIGDIGGDGSDPVVGLGYGYNFNRTTGLVLLYEVAKMTGINPELDLDDEEFKALSLGVRFNF